MQLQKVFSPLCMLLVQLSLRSFIPCDKRKTLFFIKVCSLLLYLLTVMLLLSLKQVFWKKSVFYGLSSQLSQLILFKTPLEVCFLQLDSLVRTKSKSAWLIIKCYYWIFISLELLIGNVIINSFEMTSNSKCITKKWIVKDTQKLEKPKHRKTKT